MHNEVTYAFENYVCARLCFFQISEANVYNSQSLLWGIKIRFLPNNKSFKDSMYC